MAARAERIKVEVTDSTEGETRTFKIVLMVPNSDFQLADLLRQRGVISSINGELKQSVKVATQNYLASAEERISTLTKVSTTTLKAGNNRTERTAMPPASARLRLMLLNYDKGVSRVAIDDCDSLRQDPMTRLIHKALWFSFEIPSREFETLRGALHLNLFDTSPLQVHTHANFCMRM